eukprot:scaffold3727_cov341-Prasinococcus_capsulatus_cf.AAC.1
MQATSFNDGLVYIYISKGAEAVAGSEEHGYDYTGKLVDNASFDYSYSGPFSAGNPQERRFCWSPAHGQEGVYEICFGAVDSLQEKPRTFSGEIDQRCYTIHVTEAAAFMTTEVSITVPQLAEHLHDTCGFSVGMWVLPRLEDDLDEMSLVTAGYHFDVDTVVGRETVSVVMHQLRLAKYFNGVRLSAVNGVGGTQRRLLGATERSARRLLQTDPDPQIAQQTYTGQRVPGSDTLWTVTWTWTYNTDITGFEMSFNATGGSLTEDQLATIVSFEYGDPVMLNLTRREAAQVTNVTEPGTIKAAANSFDYTQFRLYVDCNETIGSAETVCVEVYTTVAYVITVDTG